MKDLEDFIIDAPYNITPADYVLINQASPNGEQSDDWEKSCLDDFKQRVRDYYRKKQNRRCAYCRTIVRTGQSSPEVEHIVPKSDRPMWMYEPFNLCMSCKACNTKKSTKNVLTYKNIATFPYDSQSYLLVHPHIDRYSQHINLIDDILYEGLTDKGRETIRTCGLNRYELAADRAEDRIKEERTLDEKALLALVNHNGQPLVNVLAKFEERIHEICEEYNSKQPILTYCRKK